MNEIDEPKNRGGFLKIFFETFLFYIRYLKTKTKILTFSITGDDDDIAEDPVKQDAHEDEEDHEEPAKEDNKRNNNNGFTAFLYKKPVAKDIL